MSGALIWGKGITGRGKNQFWGPKALACLVCWRKSQIFTQRKWTTVPWDVRQKRLCVRATGTSLGYWLHSWVLPRADEYSPYPLPSLSGTSVPGRMYTHACVLHIDQAEITKLLNSGWSQMPRVRTLPHWGRGSSKGWKEPLLYRLILLWISCLPRLPNLTSAKPSFTFYESGQLWKETWFHIRLEQRSFSVVCGLRQKPGPPISGLCLRLLNVGRWEANQKSWPACSPPGPARAEGDRGVRHSALGCFLHDLGVLLTIWSSAERRCDKPLLCTAKKSLCLMVLWVIWAGAWEQRKREESKSLSWLSGMAPKEQDIVAISSNCVISHV